MIDGARHARRPLRMYPSDGMQLRNRRGGSSLEMQRIGKYAQRQHRHAASKVGTVRELRQATGPSSASLSFEF